MIKELKDKYFKYAMFKSENAITIQSSKLKRMLYQQGMLDGLEDAWPHIEKLVKGLGESCMCGSKQLHCTCEACDALEEFEKSLEVKP